MINEVAPPGWGHTKAEKEKTKPNKPKSKIGGSSAAFKRALDDGRFKGLPGDKTKEEKTASMFKIMWAAKKKGYKPHYKPGTDEKYKKYQEEKQITPMQDNNLFGNAYAGSIKKKKKKKLEEKVSGGRSKWLSTAIEKEREQHRAQRRTAQAHKKSKEAQKLAMAKRQSRIDASAKRNQVKTKKKESQKPKAPQFNAAKELVQDSPYMKPALQQRNEGVSFKNFYKTAKKAISKKQDERKPEKAMDAGARAKRRLARREYQSKVSTFVPDELKD